MTTFAAIIFSLYSLVIGFSVAVCLVTQKGFSKTSVVLIIDAILIGCIATTLFFNDTEVIKPLLGFYALFYFIKWYFMEQMGREILAVTPETHKEEATKKLKRDSVINLVETLIVLVTPYLLLVTF